jgi:hypothetical protein
MVIRLRIIVLLILEEISLPLKRKMKTVAGIVLKKNVIK